MMNVKSETEKVRYFRVDRKDLVFLKFILEAYEGLSTMSTADRKEGIVRISFAEWAEADIGSLLDSLAREIKLTEVDVPMEAAGA
jgi:hypothetical protein